jgi:site-specific recombinase XerD
MTHATSSDSGAAAIPGIPPEWSWVEFWSELDPRLRGWGYQRGTRKLHRQVLRGFRSFCRCRPAQVTRDLVQQYLYHLGRRGLSASWIASNVTVLRTAFDRFASRRLLDRIRSPRRGDRLPEILSPADVARVIDAADTLRDRLLLSLLYGCGLKASEACRLRWKDVDPGTRTLTVQGAWLDAPRRVLLPEDLLPLLREFRRTCPLDAPVFRGRAAGAPLSTRMAEVIVHRCGRAAAIGLPVTSMTLRHAYAVHALASGLNLRELQEILGHRRLETTQRYLRCLLPPGAVSPIDLMDEAPAPSSHPTPAAPVYHHRAYRGAPFTPDTG